MTTKNDRYLCIYIYKSFSFSLVSAISGFSVSYMKLEENAKAFKRFKKTLDAPMCLLLCKYDENMLDVNNQKNM